MTESIRGAVPVASRVVLLGGAVRQTSFASLVERSVLDLPLSSETTIGEVWMRRIREALSSKVSSRINLVVSVLLGREDPSPSISVCSTQLAVDLRRDQVGYRGTAGALRDACMELAEDAFVLVGNASQCPDPGQLDWLLEWAQDEDDVTLLVGPDGTPSGLLLMRVAALRVVPGEGFVDLKEQVLPRIARAGRVRVLRFGGGVSRPIRSVRSYLDVVRSWHRNGSTQGAWFQSPLEERWLPTFAVAEEGAEVAVGARLHDSVVLSGGIVASDCDVIRCVVGPRGRTRTGSVIVGELVASGMPPGSGRLPAPGRKELDG